MTLPTLGSLQTHPQVLLPSKRVDMQHEAYQRLVNLVLLLHLRQQVALLLTASLLFAKGFIL